MTTGEPMISAGRRPATSRHIGRRWLWTRSAIDYGACRTSPTSSVSRPERSTAGAAAASDPAHAESAGTCATRSRKSGPGSSARAMLSHRAHATTGLPSAIDSFGAINDDTCARSARLSTDANGGSGCPDPFTPGINPATRARRPPACLRPAVRDTHPSSSTAWRDQAGQRSHGRKAPHRQAGWPSSCVAHDW